MSASQHRSFHDVMHRHVVVRYEGSNGRTTIRSWVIGAAVDVDDVVTDVEVAAEIGALFPIGADTFDGDAVV